MKRMIAASILICLSGTASAQAPSYEPWRPPGDPAVGTEGLLRELTMRPNAIVLPARIFLPICAG